MTGRPDYRLKPKLNKICDVCGKEFVTSFSNRKRCSKHCSKEFHQKEYQRYIYPYGITSEEYNSRFESQGGSCYICQRHQTELKSKLNIDHCHRTGYLRALLCNQCNQALGLVREDPEVIQNMLEYVS
jgi:Recombination endonuclease VII